MNSFLSPMTEIITEQKGTIDKYIGDCIMAFWNAPLDDPEHVQNAVRAAQAMRRKLAELNREWEAEAAYRVILPVRFGIGINTGECVVGNFGSEAHFDYSLLGDPVNLASRLEGLGKVYGIDLIIGEETAASLDDPTLLELDLVAVKGKTQAGRIFTLPAEQVEGDEFIKEHSALLTACRIGQRRCTCSTTAGSPRRATSRPSTNFIASGSRGSRPRPRRPIGTAFSPRRRSEKPGSRGVNQYGIFVASQ
jgi:adenylate cyclase